MSKKLNETEKSNIWEITWLIVGIMMFFLMSRFFRWTLNATNQIFIDTLYFKGASIFCLIVLMFRRVDYKNWRLYAITLGYIGYALYFLISNNGGYGPDAKVYFIWQFVFRCLIILIFVDAFNKNEITHLEKKNLTYSIIFIVTFVFCSAIKFNAMFHVLFPALVLFITPLSEIKWKKFLFCFSCGYYLTYLVYMIQSLIVDSNMSGFRYYMGNFGSPYGAGVLTMGGLISALYLFELIKGKKHILLTIVSFLSIIFPCVMAFIIGSRSIQLAAFAVVFLYFFMYEGKTERETKQRRRIMLVVLGFMILIGIVFILAILKCNITVGEEIIGGIHNEVIRNKLIYYIGRINGLSDTSSYGVVFADGSKINILDHLSAERISIWYMYMKNVTLWGNDVIESVDGYGPHSIYVYWLVKYGWIGGSLCILSAFVGFIMMWKRLSTNRKVYLIPFLWTVYFLAAGIGEQPFMEFDIAVFYVVFQYPLLFQLEGADTSMSFEH